MGGSEGHAGQEQDHQWARVPDESVFVITYDGYASVGGFAGFVFELDGGVVDFEFVSEAIVDSAQNRVAFGGGDVRDFNVGG